MLVKCIPRNHQSHITYQFKEIRATKVAEAEEASVNRNFIIKLINFIVLIAR